MGGILYFSACVIPCEHDNLTHLNFAFKLEPCLDHVKVSEELKPGVLDLDLQSQIGLQTYKIFVSTLKKLNCSEFYLPT